jgi:hypothetical protein
MLIGFVSWLNAQVPQLCSPLKLEQFGKTEECNPIFIKHMSLWCLFVDLAVSTFGTHQSNIGDFDEEK